MHNFRTKGQSRVWVVLPCSPILPPTQNMSQQASYDRRMTQAKGSKTRNPQNSRSLFIFGLYMCDQWCIFKWVGWWIAYHEMPISDCTLRRCDSLQGVAVVASFNQKPPLAKFWNVSAKELVTQWVTKLHCGTLWEGWIISAVLWLIFGWMEDFISHI